VAKKLDDPPVAQTAAAAQALQYTLAPAVVVNQAALDAGAALARELAVQEVATGQCSDEDYPAASRVLHEPARHALRAVVPQPVLPVRSPTLFEHRIRETLLHPARSRPFADLVQRLRQDFRGSQQRSLLFTGIGLASRGDEMLAHVAALFAEQGEKLLLVDADFERAGLTAGLGAGTVGGLQQALVNPRTWQDHVVPTAFQNLAFLPTGRGNLNAATAGDVLATLIPKLETEFPLVLIDGGQSSGPIVTPLARSCDATYFVIRLGTTDAKEAQAALKMFRGAGARVMGCVATMDGA
jgi:Mrp family chromosome partitioning ATPase